jgi:hypothetical protein
MNVILNLYIIVICKVTGASNVAIGQFFARGIPDSESQYSLFLINDVKLNDLYYLFLFHHLIYYSVINIFQLSNIM